MRYNQLGDSELRVSEICLGTMTFGQQNTEREAHEQLDLAFARGVNFIDAAEMYPVPIRAETQGLTEEYIGTWCTRSTRARRSDERSVPMIELVSDSRCIKCDICVDVCPTNVFDRVPDEIPVIARQEDCQTCFMCEVYCPVDALYVAPQAEQKANVDEPTLSEQGLLGSYRRAVGWGPKRTPGAASDASFRVLEAAKV